MQSSRVLAMAWSPGRSGEIAISTKDGSLRVWDVNDFDNALLVSNYKKIPMFHLRYTVSSFSLYYIIRHLIWMRNEDFGQTPYFILFVIYLFTIKCVRASQQAHC